MSHELARSDSTPRAAPFFLSLRACDANTEASTSFSLSPCHQRHGWGLGIGKGQSRLGTLGWVEATACGGLEEWRVAPARQLEALAWAEEGVRGGEVVELVKP